MRYDFLPLSCNCNDLLNLADFSGKCYPYFRCLVQQKIIVNRKYFPPFFCALTPSNPLCRHHHHYHYCYHHHYWHHPRCHCHHHHSKTNLSTNTTVIAGTATVATTTTFATTVPAWHVNDFLRMANNEKCRWSFLKSCNQTQENKQSVTYHFLLSKWPSFPVCL